MCLKAHGSYLGSSTWEHALIWQSWVIFINNNSLEIQVFLISHLILTRKLGVNIYWLHFMAEKTEAPKDLVICPYSHLTSSWTLNLEYCFVLFRWNFLNWFLNSSLVWCLLYVCAQLCLTLCDPMDCSPPGSSIHGILQARILEWAAISSLLGSSQNSSEHWRQFWRDFNAKWHILSDTKTNCETILMKTLNGTSISK